MATILSRFMQFSFFLLLVTGNVHAMSSPTSSEQESSVDLTASADVAEQWVKWIDAGKYDESWEQASVRLKRLLPKAEWNMYLNTIRKPLGQAQNRVLMQQTPAENPKGLAPGKYMVILFNTNFSKKGPMQELLTLAFEGDSWRVLSYHIGNQ